MRRIAAFSSHTISSHDGLHIYYELAGGGEMVLVFIHGLGGDVAAWDEERVFFHRLGYRTLAIDLRGHGFSDHPRVRSGFALTELAKDIKTILEQEKIVKFVLIGHCYGGMVVYTFEALYPQLAEALVLINSSYRAPYLRQNSLLRRLVRRVLPLAASISPGIYTKRHVDYSAKKFEHDFEPLGFFRVLKYNSLKTYLYATEAIFSLHVIPLLKEIQTPVLIIAGSKDSIFPVKMSKAMHEFIEKSRFQVIARANHPVVLNLPVTLSSKIEAFFRDISLVK